MEVVFNIVYNSTEEGKKQAGIIRQALIAKGLKYQDKEDAISYMPADMEAYVESDFIDPFEITADKIQETLEHFTVEDGIVRYDGMTIEEYQRNIDEINGIEKLNKHTIYDLTEKDEQDYGDEDQNDVMNTIRKHLPDDD